MAPPPTPPRFPGRTRSRRGLDRIDRSILSVLRENGRITNQSLAETVGLSPRPCLERVRRLERSGVIIGYAALLDPNVIGHAVVALAEIALRDGSAATRQRVERALSAHPAVVELQVISGQYDYVARIVAPSIGAYEAMTGDFLGDPAYGIARIHTTFVLRSLKDFRGYPVDVEEGAADGASPNPPAGLAAPGGARER